MLESYKACNFIKKWLQHRCFRVKFVRFLRTSILENMRTAASMGCLFRRKIKESARWHTSVFAYFACFTCLSWSRAHHASVLYVIACLACLTCSRVWRVGVLQKINVLGVLHKVACFVSFIKSHAWCASKIGVLGVLHKMTRLAYLACFIKWRAWKLLNRSLE